MRPPHSIAAPQAYGRETAKLTQLWSLGTQQSSLPSPGSGAGHAPGLAWAPGGPGEELGGSCLEHQKIPGVIQTELPVKAFGLQCPGSFQRLTTGTGVVSS